ncbi:cysteine synthase B [Escherichia coli]|nr:cysteine synthase B [Escherichia coli]
MEGARDLALEMANRGEGKVLDQFNNHDNPYAHYNTTWHLYKTDAASDHRTVDERLQPNS